MMKWSNSDFLKNNQGLFYTVALSVLCLFYFYSSVVLNINQVVFAPNGDGLQAYFTALYHVHHDANFWQFSGLNYPYGEQVFFTGCQPFITNLIKILQPIIDLTSYTIGILNTLMLGSIVVSAAYLFLLFQKLGVSNTVSILSAVFIAFLSPQIDRLGGHLSLTYACAIPMFLYYVYCFSDTTKLKYTVYLSFITFFFAGTHLYFVVFFACIISVFYFYAFLLKKSSLKVLLIHGFFQIVFPIILFQWIQFIVDSGEVRTAYPWGFLESYSNLSGVFASPGKWYSKLYEWIGFTTYPTWEGFSFVGLFGGLSALVLTLQFSKKTLFFRFKKALMFTDNWVLNSFILAAVFALIFSFALPFRIAGYEKLLLYSGPIKQFRGVGRFAWLFFYVINIYGIYYLTKMNSRKSIVLALTSISLFFMAYDAYTWNVEREKLHNKILPELSAKNFYATKYKWYKSFDKNAYQAIIPLPYFHNGSENIWMEPESDLKRHLYPFSIKTGIPICGVNLSRTPLNQTYENIALVLEPYRPLNISKKWNKKPFLIVAREHQLSEYEQHILQNATLLHREKAFSLFEISVASLKRLHVSYKRTKMNELDSLLKQKSPQLVKLDSLPNSTLFLQGSNDFRLFNPSFFKAKRKETRVLIDEKISNLKDTNYLFSCWVKNFTTDLTPRTTLEIVFQNEQRENILVNYVQLKDGLKTLDGSNALLEFPLSIPKKTRRIFITVFNQLVKEESVLEVDQLLLRESTCIVNSYSKEFKSYWINNRFYSK